MANGTGVSLQHSTSRQVQEGIITPVVASYEVADKAARPQIDAAIMNVVILSRSELQPAVRHAKVHLVSTVTQPPKSSIDDSGFNQVI